MTVLLNARHDFLFLLFTVSCGGKSQMLPTAHVEFKTQQIPVLILRQERGHNKRGRLPRVRDDGAATQVTSEKGQLFYSSVGTGTGDKSQGVHFSPPRGSALLGARRRGGVGTEEVGKTLGVCSGAPQV